jgi:phytoene desaturase
LAGETMADHIEMLPVHPFYRLLWTDGAKLDYDGDEAFMDAEVKRLAPDDLAGYRRFIEYSRKVFDAGYTNLAAKPFLRFRDMVRVAPQLAKLRADRSVYGAVSKYVKDEHLRQALSFHALLIGGNPFETSAIYTLIPFLERKWGVFFPKGGTGALVSALVALFERLGGTVKLSSPVQSVRVLPGGQHSVTAEGQPAKSFDLVVSNADLHHTYARLYSGEPTADKQRQKLEKMDWSMSLFVLYFGTKKKYPGVAHHTVIFGPRYKELLRDIFHGDHLPDDFSLYLHAPTVTDPSLGPPDSEAFYVLAPVPHLGNAKIDWEQQKEKYADRILEYLETWLPDLRANVVTRRTFTPTDFQSTLNAWNGSAFSVSPRLTQSAYFRPHNRDADIKGLYIVGAGTHPGAGVPGVINSAKATAFTVLGDLGLA